LNKAILSGNEAIARGFLEAGGKLAAAYPGTPSTEVLETLSREKHIHAEWSVNEKVALEVAIGGSLSGVRSMACMKHVGVNVAADPLNKQIEIPREALLETARRLAGEGFDNLHCITAIDKKDAVEIVYIFYSMERHAGTTVRVRLAPNDLSIESLANIWRSADWLEREVYDLFGVKFSNHPNLKRILNPDDWTIHPLRKT